MSKLGLAAMQFASKAWDLVPEGVRGQHEPMPIAILSLNAFIMSVTLLWEKIWQTISHVPRFDATIQGVINDLSSVRHSSVKRRLGAYQQFSHFSAQQELKLFALALEDLLTWPQQLIPCLREVESAHSFSTDFLHHLSLVVAECSLSVTEPMSVLREFAMTVRAFSAKLVNMVEVLPEDAPGGTS